MVLQEQTVPREWLPCDPEPELRLFVFAGVCLLEKLELCLHRPMPLVTRDSSMALQIMTQSFLNCLVKMA